MKKFLILLLPAAIVAVFSAVIFLYFLGDNTQVVNGPILLDLRFMTILLPQLPTAVKIFFLVLGSMSLIIIWQKIIKLALNSADSFFM